MEHIELLLFVFTGSVFFVCMVVTDYLKELTFERRIENDAWREKHGYTRGLLGGWKRPKDRKKSK